MEPGNRTPGAMTGAEIGIVVATVICFVLLVATIFWCRYGDQRHRLKDALHRAEEGEVEGQEKHQSQQKDDGQVQGQEEAPGSGQKQSKGRHWWEFATKPSYSTQARAQGASGNEACQGK